MTSLNPEYFWYFAFRVSLFWKFWKYHLEINFAWFTSQSWFYPESEIILKIKTCLFLNFEIKMSKNGQKFSYTVQFTRHTTRSVSWKFDCGLSWHFKLTLWLALRLPHCDWLISWRKRRLVRIELKVNFNMTHIMSYKKYIVV